MKTTNTTFPVLVHNHETNERFFIYTLEDFLEFLNENDDFFTYSTKEITQ
jgi:hypothetical protein